MFHALGHFIFKRRFEQYTMCYSFSEYCVWLLMLWFFMTDFFLDGIIWTSWKRVKTFSDLGSRVRVSWHDFGIFFEILVRWRTGLCRKWRKGVNAVGYNRNNWCLFLILVRILIERKRRLGSWHKSGSAEIRAIFPKSTVKRCIDLNIDLSKTWLKWFRYYFWRGFDDSFRLANVAQESRYTAASK